MSKVKLMPAKGQFWVSNSSGGLVYIADPGDGSGITTALAQADGPGDVWIRPGTYTSTQPRLPFTLRGRRRRRIARNKSARHCAQTPGMQFSSQRALKWRMHIESTQYIPEGRKR